MPLRFAPRLDSWPAYGNYRFQNTRTIVAAVVFDTIHPEQVALLLQNELS